MKYIDEIGSILIKSDRLLKSMYSTLTPIYKEQFGPGQDVTVPLFTTLHSTSESVLALLFNQVVFDADVLLRTVMEGTVKYCYLMIGSQNERYDKYIEYKYKTTEIDMLLDHFKALETINILERYSGNSIEPFKLSILSIDEVERLQKIYPAKVRNDIKRKWSYQSLMRNLADIHPEYEAQLGSFSTYSLTSHLSHFDWTGVSSRQAQISDAPYEENVIFDVGHAIRIIANLLSFEVFRVTEYLRGNNYSSVAATNLAMETIVFITELIQQGNGIIESAIKENP